MKTLRMILTLALALALCIPACSAVFAATYNDAEPGLEGIQPGDSLTLPEDTAWANLTAVWGVRVTYLVGVGTLDSVVVEEGETVDLPDAPNKAGYTFEGWERTDGTDGVIELTEDTLTVVSGPGPIEMKAVYAVIPGEEEEEEPDDIGGLAPLPGEEPEEPAETPVEEPVETPVEEPAETPAEEPAETPEEPEELTPLDDEEVPLSDVPVTPEEPEEAEEMEELEEEPVPLAGVPETSENSGIWALLAMTAASLLAVAELLRKKRAEK